MKNLKRVSLPQSVTTLEHNVFYKDNQLQVFGAENGFVYLKKTGELLYYANKSEDPVLPKSIRKIMKKTYWCTSYINKFTLSKNVKYVNGNYLPVREGYLRKFYISGKIKLNL